MFPRQNQDSDKDFIDKSAHFVHIGAFLVIPKSFFPNCSFFFHVDSMSPDTFFGHEVLGKYFLYCLEVF